MDKSIDNLSELFEGTRELFVAFGDWYRQDIVVLLSGNPNMTVRELAEAINLSRPAVSHHLKILKDAGMLANRKEGTRTYYYPTLDEPFARLKQLIDTAQRFKKL